MAGEEPHHYNNETDAKGKRPTGAPRPRGKVPALEHPARERLAALKPSERRTLGLIAAGCSYAEVGQITGFSYTQINRCASEGPGGPARIATGLIRSRAILYL